MAKKNKTEDQFIHVEEALSKTEQYIVDNQKSLMIIIGAIVGIVVLFNVYQKFYIQPLEEEAQIEMYMAELYFQKDSFSLALNGDGQYAGFLDVAEDYSSTNVGNLANYYSGICFLNLGEYESAIEYLSDFSSNDIILSSLAYGCIGDAYMQLGDKENAKEAYIDAVQNSSNEFTSPRYMMKLAMIHESNSDYSDALDIYKTIKEHFNESKQAIGIEKYISRAQRR
jgi:TolA-binding protein